MNKWKIDTEKTSVGMQQTNQSIVSFGSHFKCHITIEVHIFLAYKMVFNVNEEHGNTWVIQSVFYFICSTCFFCWLFFFWVGIVRSQGMYSSSALNRCLRFSGVTQHQQLLIYLHGWIH